MKNEVAKRDEEMLTREISVMPLTDIYETEGEYILKLEVPGVVKDDIDITLEDNELSISADVAHSDEPGNSRHYREYSLDRYHRSFKLGNDINRDSISAGLDKGILTVTLNKADEVKPKKIAINAH